MEQKCPHRVIIRSGECTEPNSCNTSLLLTVSGGQCHRDKQMKKEKVNFFIFRFFSLSGEMLKLLWRQDGNAESVQCVIKQIAGGNTKQPNKGEQRLRNLTFSTTIHFLLFIFKWSGTALLIGKSRDQRSDILLALAKLATWFHFWWKSSCWNVNVYAMHLK